MAFPNRDRALPDNIPEELVVEKHRVYLENYGETIDAFEFSMGEYLRISGMYWSVTCLDLLSSLETSERFRRDLVIAYVKSCQKPCGGFAPFPNHDAALLHTLSALQILTTFDAVGDIDKELVVRYVVGLQQEDGSFVGDVWGEVDTRFSMCGLACLALLASLDRCNTDKALDFIRRCKNFDGGFGTSPGSQSHAAMIYCCLGSLAILNRLDIVDVDRLGLWLAKRQLPSGGLNGRPEKLPDVCYSWWVLASLAMIGRLDWIDGKKLKKFILASQDIEVGGIADCPGNHADPFHTVFGTAGLSLLASYCPEVEKSSSPVVLKKVNPVFCMSQEIIDRLGIPIEILTPKK